MTAATMIIGFAELSRRRVWSFTFLAFSCVVLASCGGSSSSNGSSSPPTATLTATPSTITAGANTTVTLVYTSTNATSGSINGQNAPGSQGQITVQPTDTTTYVYTATGAGGSTKASATVTVAQAPMVTSFTVNPGTILVGGGVTLSWNSTNAAYVVINANVGASPGRVGASGANVSIPSPSQTTTFTAVATTSSGAQSAGVNATLTVNPITSFNGLDSSVGGGSTEDDIDPNGAVGTKQYMEYVNTSFQGYSKIPPFTPVWSSPQSINTPWPSTSPCGEVGANGPAIQLDAVIIFDRLASRWVIAGKTTVQDDYNFCIAVSNTDDLTSPTFAWYAYNFPLDPLLEVPGSNPVSYYLPDWPKVGTWTDGYYAAMDLIDPSTQYESGVLVCAIDRNGILTNPTSTPALACYEDFGTNTTRFSNGIYLAHSLIPADVDGITPPPTGRDEFMVSIQNPQDPGLANGIESSSTINLWDFHVDWTAPATLTLENLSTPAVDTYIPGCYTQSEPGETTCVPEMGVTGLGGIKVDSVGDRLMPRFAYRNFSAAATPYESFLVSHTVQTGLGVGQDATQTGVRWYELRGDGSGSGTPSLAQQGRITPDSVYYRFLPSIAEDKNGNAAAGYSISNPSSNPGISLSYWNLNPVNANQPQEVTILNGPGEEIPLALKQGQNPNLGQWGSYADISVDPTDDCTFWYVNEYWPANTTGTPGPWATNISNFQLPGCQ
ncbi:MAG TPA: hypothetical protein VGG14_16990 [Candidatus Sulfotelmatobacter sp.]